MTVIGKLAPKFPHITSIFIVNVASSAMNILRPTYPSTQQTRSCTDFLSLVNYGLTIL